MKPRPSILDAHAEQLAEWELAGRTLAQMQTDLAAAGCTVSLSRLSDYLARQRSARLQSDLLKQIASGAAQVKTVEAEFARNPAPELDTLIRLYRVLILKLSTLSGADPGLMELATGMTRQALDFEKLLVKRSELELNRDKFEALKRQNEAAKEVVNSTLSPEEQRQRLKEILK